MKKVISCFITILFVFAVTTCDGHAAKNAAGDYWTLVELVKAFDDYAKGSGETGVWTGIKSKFRDITGRSDPAASLTIQVAWTPMFLEEAMRQRDGETSFNKSWYDSFRSLMPTRYDSYATCRGKILRCLILVRPDQPKEFYDNAMKEIGAKAGVNWL